MGALRPARAYGALRVGLVVCAVACLATGVWGGLQRLSWNLPLLTEHAGWISYHGPLMVCGFLGTVIGVERATALGSLWCYLAPALTAAGGIVVACGVLGISGPLLFTLGSAALLVVMIEVVRRQPALFTLTMAIGAAVWGVGNALWCAEWSIPSLVLWWVAFPTLTIAAERLELNRLQPPRPGSRRLFVLSTGVFIAGVVVSTFHPVFGTRLAGCGSVLLAAWLLVNDIARRTVRQRGLPRFTAVCLLSGYVWLAAAGLVAAFHAPVDQGSTYDAMLHAFFVGFVFSMIFGHAPIIFPAVLGAPIPYRSRFYAHLILLHISTAARIAGKLLDGPELARWGGLLGAIAIVVFLLNTVTSALQQVAVSSGRG